MKINTFFKRLAYLILAPVHCFSCKIMLDHESPLCDICFKQIRYLLPVDISLTSSKKISVLSLGAYEEPLSSLIRAKQHRNIAAAQQLGVLLINHFAEWKISVDYIVPVPLHWRRYAWRGFNQAEIIAATMAQAWNVPLVHLLKRTKNTAYQMTQTAETREENVRDVFTVAINEVEKYRGKHIVLIDDLMTTGATLTATGRALLTVKPASVTAIVACRVP